MLDSQIGQRAFDILEAIHKDLDYLEATLSFHLGGPICVPNCGRCCMQSFLVPEISAQYIASRIKSLPAQRQEVIVGRLERWLLYELPGVRFNFSDNGDGENEQAVRQSEYTDTSRLWCPFLNEDKRCLIHPWRDVTCRAWGVTRPMSSICLRPVYEGETEEARHYIGSGNKLVEEVQFQTALLKGFLGDYLPTALRKGWLPTIVYRLLRPKQWDTISAKVQETKIAKYDGSLNWLLTKEDVDQRAIKEDSFLEKSIKI